MTLEKPFDYREFISNDFSSLSKSDSEISETRKGSWKIAIVLSSDISESNEAVLNLALMKLTGKRLEFPLSTGKLCVFLIDDRRIRIDLLSPEDLCCGYDSVIAFFCHPTPSILPLVHIDEEPFMNPTRMTYYISCNFALNEFVQKLYSSMLWLTDNILPKSPVSEGDFEDLIRGDLIKFFRIAKKVETKRKVKLPSLISLFNTLLQLYIPLIESLDLLDSLAYNDACIVEDFIAESQKKSSIILCNLMKGCSNSSNFLDQEIPDIISNIDQSISPIMYLQSDLNEINSKFDEYCRVFEAEEAKKRSLDKAEVDSLLESIRREKSKYQKQQ